jgi:hypothetical protein
MDPRTRNAFVLAIVFVVGVTAAAASILGCQAQRGPGLSSDLPTDAQQVVGVIVAVDSAGLTNVRGFTLRANGDTDLPFVLDQLENGAEFPPGHLVEHQAAASPIRVWYRTEGGVNHAIRLEDAEPTG